MTTQDPTTLSLEELRAARAELQHEDDVVSYARRVAQARLDLIKAELSWQPPFSTPDAVRRTVGGAAA